MQNELNMAKDRDMRNRGNALIEILHARVRNSEWSLYSICRSLSGCWPSCAAVTPQGAARGVNLSRHSVPSHDTIWSLNVALSQPFSLSENPISIAHGAAIEHFLSRRSAPHSNAASFSRQSLKGSDRYSLRHRRRTCATSTTPSLKGSDKYDIIYSHNL